MFSAGRNWHRSSYEERRSFANVRSQTLSRRMNVLALFIATATIRLASVRARICHADSLACVRLDRAEAAGQLERMENGHADEFDEG